jgi:membrane-bound lytic murein transglycosylase MltF
VAAPHVPRPLSPADLAGHTVSVATGSSYESSLRKLSATLVSQGLAPIQIGSPGSALTSEDLLELVAAGVLDYTVCDDYLVEAWQEALPGMVPCPEVALRTDGQVGWATRKDAPELRAVLDDFLAQHKKGSLIGNVLFKRYLAEGQQLLSMDGVAAVLGPYEEPLRRLADEYGFDWRLIAAQVYQESRFDPDARSGSGAIGLMQLLPSTAKDMGFSDLRNVEDNLHAGIKYMAWLRENYFDEPGLPEDEQVCFVLAAYNAGVGRVRRWRKEAAAQGLDPDRWHEQVEHLALADVGRQPVDYVDTIEKFVIGLSLLLDIDRNVLAEREELGRDG